MDFKVVIAALLSVAQLSACADSSKIDKDLGYLVDTAVITENVDRLIGKSVLVRNDVLQTIGKNGLILDKDRLLDGQPILVINTSEALLSETFLNLPSEDSTPEILIEGEVERFSLNSIEQRYDVNLEADLYRQHEGKPVIIATSIILSPDPEDLTANPEIYYDLPLAIKGEVDDVMEFGVFELDEEQAFGGEDLVVIQSGSKVQLYEEQTVIVYGRLRQFIAEEFEQDYDLVISKIEAEYDRQPVFVAQKIQVLP